jgi:hypothetical protein
MDFRMEKSSYALLALIFFTMIFFILSGAGNGLSTGQYGLIAFYALLVTIALIALCCIPVIIYCYIVKKIPDIDYSIWLAAAVTLVGIISEMFN